MESKDWQPGGWAKVGDLVRLYNPKGEYLNVLAIVLATTEKPHVGMLVRVSCMPDSWIRTMCVRVYRPNFDYDKARGL